MSDNQIKIFRNVFYDLFPKIKYIYFQNNAIDSFETLKFQPIIELNLENNKIKSLNDSKMDLNILKILNLKNNPIVYFYPNLPEKFLKLEELYLDDTYFINLLNKNNPISNSIISDITLFYLRNRKLSILKEYYFDRLPNITGLYLTSNQIESIERNSLKLFNLKYLCLTNNLLNKILKYYFIDSINIENLILDKNKINQIEPGSFDSLIKLKRINLNYNHLKLIDPTLFNNSNNLNNIYLSFNSIQNEKFEMNNLKVNLKEIFSDNNNITKLIKFNCVNINFGLKLNLSKNSIKILDSNTFSDCFNKPFDEINLDYNQIDALNQLNGLNRLNKLSLNYNEINKIDANAFKNINKLTILSLISNNLTFINDEFKNDNIENLFLDYNLISSIKNTTFSRLKNLKNITLSHNRLKIFETNSFNIKSLNFVDLSFNLINVIKFKMFDNLPELKAIYLGNFF